MRLRVVCVVSCIPMIPLDLRNRMRRIRAPCSDPDVRCSEAVAVRAIASSIIEAKDPCKRPTTDFQSRHHGARRKPGSVRDIIKPGSLQALDTIDRIRFAGEYSHPGVKSTDRGRHVARVDRSKSN